MMQYPALSLRSSKNMSSTVVFRSLVLLLLLSAFVAAAAPENAKKGKQEYNPEDLKKKIQITYNDGNSEETTVEEVAKRLAESEKTRRMIANPSKVEVEQKTMSVDEVDKSKPELGGFIKRSKAIFEILQRRNLVPNDAQLAGLSTSEHVEIKDTPQNEEYLVLKLKRNGKPLSGVEVHVRYSQNAILLREAWQVNDDSKREKEIDLSSWHDEDYPTQSWIHWILNDPEATSFLALLLVAVGVACAVVGVAGFILVANDKPKSTRETKKDK